MYVFTKFVGELIMGIWTKLFLDICLPYKGLNFHNVNQ